jgi:FkbM family methyltransferase
MNRMVLKRAAGAVRRALVRSGADRILAELTVGAPVRSLRARLAPGHLLYEPPTFRTVVRNGIRFELDLSDYMQWCAYFGIAIEPRRALYALVQPGQIAIDVGANVGEVLLNFARLVGNEGKAIGLEINPRTYRRCLHNIAINSFRNVQVFDLGLGREKGRLVLGRPTARNSGGDRIAAGPDRDGIPVTVTTLDDFVRDLGIERVDVLKVDVEGFEMNVLRGAEATVTRFKPRMFVEIDDDNLRQQESSARELVGWLERFGYEITHAEQSVRVRSSDPFEGRHFDVIAR